MFDITTDIIHCRLGSSTFLRRKHCKGILLWKITLTHYFSDDERTVFMNLLDDDLYTPSLAIDNLIYKMCGSTPRVNLA